MMNPNDWDWGSNPNFPLYEYKNKTLWVRPDDRLEFNGDTYIYFRDLPEDLITDMESHADELNIINNMIIINYLKLVSNYEVKDVDTGIKKDKRIFITYQDKLYYVVDYENLR